MRTQTAIFNKRDASSRASQRRLDILHTTTDKANSTANLNDYLKFKLKNGQYIYSATQDSKILSQNLGLKKLIIPKNLQEHSK